MTLASPIVARTIAEVLDRAADHHGGRPALVTRSDRLDYTELRQLADRAAHALTALGVKAGDRLAACLPNDTDVVAAFHGAMRLGAIWVGIGRALAPPEKHYLLRDSGASILLCDQATAASLGSPDETSVLVVGPDPSTSPWLSALQSAPATPWLSNIDPDAPAGIAYTSGTTGYPKGVLHSQRNLVLPGASLVASRGYGPGLRKGDCFSLTILNMQVLTTVLVAQAGGCAVIMDRIDAVGVAEWIRAEQVTTWNGPPALIYSLAVDPAIAPTSLASLDEVWVGGDECPEETRAAFQERFGKAVLATYGLTEAPTIVTIDPRDGSHVVGASGKPLDHIEVHIAGTEGSNLSGPDIGEIEIGPVSSGPWSGAYRPMLGYWGQGDEEAGWQPQARIRTGDLGFVDGHGYLHVSGRKNLVIIRGGANIYPAEIERVVRELPTVAACAVVGVADERLGQRVVAAVQASSPGAIGADKLTRHCLANLAKYKVPERWVFVDSFERNAMGKISRLWVQSLFE